MKFTIGSNSFVVKSSEKLRVVKSDVKICKWGDNAKKCHEKSQISLSQERWFLRDEQTKYSLEMMTFSLFSIHSAQ